MKIGLCGTMSVGKTTLINYIKDNNLLDNYNFATERSKELMNMGVPLNDKSTYKGQLIFFAERARELMSDNILTDRTVIDVLAFSRVSIDINPAEKYVLENIYSSLVKEYDVVIYIPPIIEMEDNGIRETNIDYRRIIDDNIKEIFDNYEGRKHILKSHTVKDRVKELIDIVKEVELK